LKLLGFTVSFFVLGRNSGIMDLFSLNNRTSFPYKKEPQFASAQQNTGSWSSGPNTTINPIHAALLPTGKIFYLAGSGWNNTTQFGPYEARVLDINTGWEKGLQQSEDLFCMGQATLADGTLLLAGGTLLYDGNPDNCNGKWHGLNSAYEFKVGSESLNKTTSMAHGRWYPTLVTLPDGKVWVCSGNDEYGRVNRIVEVYDSSSKSWTIIPDPNSNYNYCVGAGQESTCTDAGSHCYNGASPESVSLYPRTHLMPNGLLVICGMRREIWSWDQANGAFAYLGRSSTYRYYGTSFLLPLQNTASERGKILLVGGSLTGSDYAFTRVEMLDFNSSSTSSPVVRDVSPLVYRRKWLAPVILPNGKLLVLGGADRATYNPVYIPEIFDPISETWQSDSSAAMAPRVYHCVALLLPDGRVWIAGGMLTKGVCERGSEFFSPDYLFATPRPTISKIPRVGDYGASIIIQTPDASNITSVSLVRLMNTTHHYDPNQRLVWLQIINRSSSSITVSAPINPNIAPPGHYMIFILSDSGIPSVAKIIKIPGSADTTPPSQVTSLIVTTKSYSELKLSWDGNPVSDGTHHYNVYRGTTAGFAATPGTTVPISKPTANSYSNTGLKVFTTYYYRVAAVDAAGNIGPLSSEASGTTFGDTTKPSLQITNPAAESSLSAGTILVEGIATDNPGGIGVRDVYTRIDQGGYTIATPKATGDWSMWSKSYNITAAGSHTISAVAKDKVGNSAWAVVKITITKVSV
jgi:hypothetical protein